jgi:hypothetical protein
MSRIAFNSKMHHKRVKVVGGWDRPLQHYHLTVFNIEPNVEDDEEVIWDQMEHIGFPKSILPLQAAVAELGIEVPDGFWERCERREGNTVYSFADGEWLRSEL